MNIIKNVKLNVSMMVTLSLFLGLFFVPLASQSQSIRQQLRQCLSDLEDQEELTLRVRKEKEKAFAKIHNLNDILSKVNGGCVLEKGDDGTLNVDHDSLSSTGSSHSSQIASVSLKCVDTNLLFTNLNSDQTCVIIDTDNSEDYYKQKRYVSIKTVKLNSGVTYYFLMGSTEELRMLSTDSESSFAKEAIFRRGPGRLSSVDENGGEIAAVLSTACEYNPGNPFCTGYYGIVSVSSNNDDVYTAYNYVNDVANARIINGQEIRNMLIHFNRTLTIGDQTTELSDQIYEKSDLLSDTTTELYTDNASYIPMFKELKSRLSRIVNGETTEQDWSFCSESENEE